MATTTNKEKMNGKAEQIANQAEDKMSAVAQNLNDLSEKAKQASSELADRSVDFAKKYPVHTALGAAAAGFVLGVFLTRSGGSN